MTQPGAYFVTVRVSTPIRTEPLFEATYGVALHVPIPEWKYGEVARRLVEAIEAVLTEVEVD
jgi:hypothetical protein